MDNVNDIVNVLGDTGGTLLNYGESEVYTIDFGSVDRMACSIQPGRSTSECSSEYEMIRQHMMLSYLYRMHAQLWGDGPIKASHVLQQDW